MRQTAQEKEKKAECTVLRLAITGLCLAISCFMGFRIYQTYKYESLPVQSTVMGFRLDPGGPDSGDTYHLRLRIKPPAPYPDSLWLETTDDIPPSARSHYPIGSPVTATLLFAPQPQVYLCLDNYRKGLMLGIVFLVLVIGKVWMRLKNTPPTRRELTIN